MTTLCQPFSENRTGHALRGRDIVCFSNDWSGDPLSKTHLMRLLARENRILWINSIGYRRPTVKVADGKRLLNKLLAAIKPVREIERNIHLLNPIALPIFGKPWAAEFNGRILRVQIKRVMRRLDFKRAINWVFLPTAAVVAGRLGEETLIYHCVDEFSAFTGNSPEAIGAMEKQLMRRADLVLVSSEKLLESKRPFNERTSLVRHGVDWNHFSRALDPDLELPKELASLPRPIIGFFGLIADWVDVDLMAHVARQFPQGSMVILGKATTDISKLSEVPNIFLLGRRPYEQLPAFCKGFDVALMPFRINRLTLNANPLKVREYLAAGLPVVSTPLPEVIAAGDCFIADGNDAFVSAVHSALADDTSRRSRSNTMRYQSWETRLNEIESILDASPGGMGVR